MQRHSEEVQGHGLCRIAVEVVATGTTQHGGTSGVSISDGHSCTASTSACFVQRLPRVELRALHGGKGKRRINVFKYLDAFH